MTYHDEGLTKSQVYNAYFRLVQVSSGLTAWMIFRAHSP